MSYFLEQKKYNKVKHHTILFGEEYFELLDKIFHKYELPTDISIYLHRPTATDNTFAPQGCDSFYALVPVPNLIAKNISWDTQAHSFRKLIIEVLERRLMPGLKNEIKHCFHMSPVDFKERYLSDAGAGFSLAPFFTQSAWFRFHNKSEIIKIYIFSWCWHSSWSRVTWRTKFCEDSRKLAMSDKTRTIFKKNSKSFFFAGIFFK